jgi:DNA primase
MLESTILNVFEKYNIKYILWKNNTEAKFLCRNPNHNDNNASCSINLETGIFGCFGCGYKGNITKFIKEITGENIKLNDLLSEQEIFEFNMKKIYSESSNQINEIQNQKEFELLLDVEFAQFTSVYRNRTAYDYLKSRKFTDATINRFRLKYATMGQYQNRVIIPYFMGNTLIGFNGRLIGVDKLQGNEQRYRYLINPTLLKKFIFNLENIDRKSDYCILVEGPFDLMYMVQSQFKNVISTLNTSISDHQLSEILRFKRIIFCFDNDRNESGIKAVFKHAKRILNICPDRQVLYAELPQGKDPNECSQAELITAFQTLKKIKMEQKEVMYEFQ